MSKFKVGQKVRINSEIDPEENGKIAVVTETDRKAKHGTAGDYRVESPDLTGGYNIYNDSELEAVPETPKAGSKFYVRYVGRSSTFNTLEEAEAHAKSQAQGDVGETYFIFQPVKAFRVSDEAQEVTLA